MPTFNTLEGLRNHLLGRTKIALEETIEEIKEELMRILDDRIYDYAEGDYERSEMLRNESNWLVTDVSRSGSSGVVSFNLNFDENKYWANGWEHIHGLCWNGGNTELPSAEDFINVLNANKSDVLYEKPDTTGFWDDFIDWVHDNFDIILAKHLQEQGIDILKM